MPCQFSVVTGCVSNNVYTHKTMFKVCCKEFNGWCRSFTQLEKILTILQAILLVILIAFTVFLIIHMIACCNLTTIRKVEHPDVTIPTEPETVQQYDKSTTTITTTTNTTTILDKKCTWEPSKKTDASTHYYYVPSVTDAYKGILTQNSESTPRDDLNETVSDELHDGVEARDVYKSFVLALVKLKPPRSITFGCLLTTISEYWSLTAASCIESIEEVDSLDSFVMLEGYGEMKQGKTHAVSDVQIHPQYQGANRSYDLAALKADDSLTSGDLRAVTLPSVIDYLVITIGERFTILGYGRFRTVETVPTDKRLREVHVYTLPARQCGGGGGGGGAGGATWSPRHLAAPRRLRRGPCGGAALCAAVLRMRARAAPCNYCAGAPLLRGRTLLGVMSDDRACGAACEPALYVNLAAHADWLAALVHAQ